MIGYFITCGCAYSSTSIASGTATSPTAAVCQWCGGTQRLDEYAVTTCTLGWLPAIVPKKLPTWDAWRAFVRPLASLAAAAVCRRVRRHVLRQHINPAQARREKRRAWVQAMRAA